MGMNIPAVSTNGALRFFAMFDLTMTSLLFHVFYPNF